MRIHTWTWTKSIRSFASFAVAASALLGANIVCATNSYTNQTPMSPSAALATCANANQAPIQNGNATVTAGHWWNPLRSGTGWDFFYDNTHSQLKVFFYTYTPGPTAYPIWFATKMAAVTKDPSGDTYQATLFSYSYPSKTATAVGSVALRFLPADPTKAAVSWDWNALENPPVSAGAQKECLVDMARLPPTAPNQGTTSSTSSSSPSSPAPVVVQGQGVNQLYSGYWNLSGQTDDVPGVAINIVETSSPDSKGNPAGEFAEFYLFTTFDGSGQPVWLQSQTSNTTAIPQAAATTIPMAYQQPLASSYPNGVPTQDCPKTQTQACNVTQSLGTITRTYDTGANAGGGAVVSAAYSTSNPQNQFTVPAQTGQVLSTTFPSATATHVYKITNSIGIFVSQYSCFTYTVGGTCQVSVSWNTASGISAFRHNLNTGVYSPLWVSGDNTGNSQANGVLADQLHQGDRVQYELWSTTGSPPVGTLNSQTPEVHAYGPNYSDGSAYIPDAPITSLSGALPAHDATVGTTEGAAGVDGGAATYRIPIVVPPGRDGAQPQLSLNYSSRGGNGVAGVGWTVSGISSIHLCPKTVAQDGISRPVQLDGADPLCLDGQRLMAVGTSGSQTVYDTEVRSFSRIMASGGTGSTSTSFTVLTKDGHTLTYGAAQIQSACGTTAAAQVVPDFTPAANKGPLSWLLTRSVDATGNNEIDYCYSVGTVGTNPGEVLLKSIYYTGSPGSPGTRFVQFDYESRPNSGSANDWSSSYIAGGLTMQTQRLMRVSTNLKRATGTEVVRDYTLSYSDPNNQNLGYSLRTGRSLLWSVTECSYLTGSKTCRNPTHFSWADHLPEFVFKSAASQLSGLPAAVQPSPLNTVVQARSVQVVGDVDGDGTPEVIVSQTNQNDSTSHAYLVKTNADRAVEGFVDISGLNAYFAPGYMADFGGDGLSEMLGSSSSSQNLVLWLWTAGRGATIGSGTATATSLFTPVPTTVPSGAQLVAAADFDGDGYTDLLMTVPSGVSGSNLGTCAPATGSTALCLFTNATRAPLQTVLPSGTFSFNPGVQIYQWAPNSGLSVQSGIQGLDLNGDGIPDIFMLTQPGGPNAPFQPTFVLMSTVGRTPAGCSATSSSAFVACSISSALGIPQDSGAAGEAYSSGSAALWIDVNGDGLTDLVYGSIATCSDQGTGAVSGAAPGNPDTYITDPLPQYGFWCIKLNTGNGFGPVISVTGDHSALESYGGQLAYGSSLSPVDVDNDGRPDILYPSAIAARVCTFVHEPSDGTECGKGGQVVGGYCLMYACSEDPQIVPNAHARPMPTSGAPGGIEIVGLHSSPWRIGGTDLSSYVFSATRFVQTGPAAFAAVSVPLSQTANGASHTVVGSVATNARTNALLPQSVYGDGLQDVVSELSGCDPTGTDKLTVNGVQVSYQHCFIDGKSSPTSLPDGTAISSYDAGSDRSQTLLTTDVTYINENIGAGTLANDSLAPIVPELMSDAWNGLGAHTEWDYAPLSSSAGRGTTLMPLYNLSDPSYVGDTEYFYFQSSMPVVNYILQDSGIGSNLGFRSFRYSYSGAIYDHLGRGFQGFRRISQEPWLPNNSLSKDPSGNLRSLRTVTTFAQKFPLTGRIVEQDVGVATGPTTMQNVSTLTNNWACNSVIGAQPLRTNYCPKDPAAPAKGASFASGPTYFVFPDTSFLTSYDFAQALQGAVQQNGTTATFYATTSSATRTNGASGWDSNGNNVQQIVTALDNSPSAVESILRTTIVNTYDSSQAAAGWVDKLQSSAVTKSTSYGLRPAPGGNLQQTATTYYAWNCDRTPLWTAITDGTASTFTPPTQGCGATPTLSGGTYSISSLRYPSPSYGLPSSSTVTASMPSGSTATFAPRTTNFGYSTDGYFVTYVTNPLSQSSGVSPRAEDGAVTSAIDPNGLTVKSTYDAFGRKIGENYYDADGVTLREPSVSTSWTSCATNPSFCQSLSVAANFVVTTVKDGAPTHIVAYDLLARVIDDIQSAVPCSPSSTVTCPTPPVGADGHTLPATYVHTDTTYDPLGTVRTSAQPYFQGGTRYATVYYYDSLNRVVRKNSPGSDLNPTQGTQQTNYTYSGSTTTISVIAQGTNACTVPNLCFTLTRISGPDGKYQQTSEPDPNAATDGNTSGKIVTNYWYDGAGNTIALQDTKSNTLSATYNGLGQRLQSNDPNQGTWNFTYDGLGELVSQTDARGAVVSVASRDALGRVLQQTASPPAVVPTGMENEYLQDNWQYDSSVIGALSVSSRLRGSSASTLSTVWTESDSYDSNTKRLTKRSVAQENEAGTLDTKYLYDTYYGREKAITYPSNFTAWKQYSVYGQLTTVLDAINLSAGWTELAADPFGHPTSELFGSSIKGTHSYFASTGQTKTLAWSNSSGTVDGVSYGYDSLGNLTSQTRGSNVESYAYDALQRLTGTTRSPSGTSRSAVNYQYDVLGNITSKSDYSTTATNAYTYGSSKPNAVTQVSLLAGGTNTYGYDANGNEISGSLTETYDANNQARTVTRGSKATFFYGPGGARYREVAPSATTIFGSDGFERSGSTYRHELGPVVYTVTSGAITPTYMLRDRLGSVLTEANSYGVVATAGVSPAQRAYDAFGKVRNGDLSDSTYGTLLLQPVTVRGFTGQEHQDDVQVIHMNGRIYDYQLGRFLGVDPIIGNPLKSQSLNPYSYIGNNPLGGVDPTGYECWDDGDRGTTCDGDGGLEQRDKMDGFRPATNWTGGGGGAKNTQGPATILVPNSPLLASANDPSVQGQPNSISGGGSQSGCQVPLNCYQSPSFGGYAGIPPTRHEIAQELIEQMDQYHLTMLAVEGRIADHVLTDFGGVAGALEGRLTGGDYVNWYTDRSMGLRDIQSSTGGVAGIVLSFVFAPAEVVAATRTTNTIDPSLVKFSQKSVSAYFSDGRTVSELAAGLRGPNADAIAAEVPPIRLFEHEGSLYTLDNRRLLGFASANRPVPYRMATESELAEELGRKLTTNEVRRWGDFISVRPGTKNP